MYWKESANFNKARRKNIKKTGTLSGKKTFFS
jgi:hypothetical protein